jgi:hypothetical protein
MITAKPRRMPHKHLQNSQHARHIQAGFHPEKISPPTFLTEEISLLQSDTIPAGE